MCTRLFFSSPSKSLGTRLFLGVNKPLKPVSASSVARWLKTMLGRVGVDTEIFKAMECEYLSSCDFEYHDRRYPKGSRLEQQGCLPEILSQIYQIGWGSVIQIAATLHCTNYVDMWDWAFWSIITEWLSPSRGCQLFWIIRRRRSRTYQCPTLAHIRSIRLIKVAHYEQGDKQETLYISRMTSYGGGTGAP